MGRSGLSRRSLIQSAIAAGAASAAAPASAQSLVNKLFKGGRGEWQDKFDAELSDQAKVIDRVPVINRDSVELMENAVRRHSQIVASGGWPEVSSKKALKLGKKDPAVEMIRRRLIVSGDIEPRSGKTEVFDSYVDAAVRRFQERHGLIADGIAGRDTIIAMNVPATTRLEQLQVNLVRMRTMAGFLGNRYVMVNIPAAEVEAVDFNRVATRHTAVVGKIDRQTPILNSKIHQINFNPYWTVPKSIIRKDLIPKMREEPSYLDDNKIRIFAPDGSQLNSQQINWNSEEALSYRFTQEPGYENSMGTMKINFHNPHAVYMHDTPSKTLFGENFRFHSSGCVRVQNIREFAAWLAKDDKDLAADEFDRIVRSGERIDYAIKKPVPVYFVYFTAWATHSGVDHFRDDIYERDAGDGVQLTQQG